MPFERPLKGGYCHCHCHCCCSNATATLAVSGLLQPLPLLPRLFVPNNKKDLGVQGHFGFQGMIMQHVLRVGSIMHVWSSIEDRNPKWPRTLGHSRCLTLFVISRWNSRPEGGPTQAIQERKYPDGPIQAIQQPRTFGLMSTPHDVSVCLSSLHKDPRVRGHFGFRSSMELHTCMIEPIRSTCYILKPWNPKCP